MFSLFSVLKSCPPIVLSLEHLCGKRHESIWIGSIHECRLSTKRHTTGFKQKRYSDRTMGLGQQIKIEEIKSKK